MSQASHYWLRCPFSAQTRTSTALDASKSIPCNTHHSLLVLALLARLCGRFLTSKLQTSSHHTNIRVSHYQITDYPRRSFQK